ncbi:unnamed protein product [Owenia fusiformis]|uniref:Uncharacterized protein n=1 Tax=Owenia fusiformis TaxID=6347 RepID=A0A8J1UUH4_OWEFU|nr:unnamed protein product [Owenia fusiformis]
MDNLATFTLFFLQILLKYVQCDQLTLGYFSPQMINMKLDDIPDATIENTGNLECLQMCVRAKTCKAFNYHGDSSKCQLFDKVACTKIYTSTGWRFSRIKPDRETILYNGNIALSKTTYQSSKVSNKLGPERVVDGNPNSYSGTDFGESSSWWIVDLGDTYKLFQIIISIRRPGAESNYYNYSVDVACEFDGVKPDNTIWKSRFLFDDILQEIPRTFPFSDSSVGRFIKITKNGERLKMYEVEVYVENEDCGCEPV